MTKSEENQNKIISQRYSKALLEFNENKISKQEVLRQLLDIEQSIEISNELKTVLTSPIISLKEKKEVVDKVFSDSDKIILNFLKLLLDKNRFTILSSIIKEYKTIIDKENNIVNIKVISAIDLNESEKAMIKVKMQKVLNKEIELEWGKDSDIIGGLIFEMDDNIVDCSLKKKLQEINKKIIV